MASPSIQEIVAQIREAIYGRDVRENIALGIETCYNDVIHKQDTTEISTVAAFNEYCSNMAIGKSATLKARDVVMSHVVGIPTYGFLIIVKVSATTIYAIFANPYSSKIGTCVYNFQTQVTSKFNDINALISDNTNLKIPYPVDPNSKYGTDGQVLQTLGDGTTKWVSYHEPTYEEIAQAISEWLEDHPEATTTVQDHSITTIKLDGERVPFYNVQDYGITPGESDVYSDLYDFLATYVYNTGGIVYFPAGKYVLSYTIFIPQNTTFIGDGDKTEIYFNQQDTTFGVGLCNAGSYVTIKNMKVSHANTGIFHNNAQPGAIGLSDISYTQAVAGKYVHTYARASVKNLTVENVTFGGNYALQTENSGDYTITNVTYKNIYASNSCVSVMPGAAINNMVVDNVICDLFRVKHSNNTYGVFNGQFNNIICRSFQFNPSQNNERNNIIVNNLLQISGERKNDVMEPNYCGLVNGDIVFNDCRFLAISTEPGGIFLGYGKRYWNRCKFEMRDKLFTRNAPLDHNSNYETMHSCIVYSTLDENTSIMLGYGKDNRINPTKAYNYLWGDMYRTYTDYAHTGIASASSTHPSVLTVRGDRVYLSGFTAITNTNNLFTLSTKLQNLPIEKGTNNPFLVTIWTQDSNNQVTVYANIDSNTNVASVKLPGYTNSTTYNRCLFNIELKLRREPTPYEIYEAFS